jgi:hypothetical protein
VAISSIMSLVGAMLCIVGVDASYGFLGESRDIQI